MRRFHILQFILKCLLLHGNAFENHMYQYKLPVWDDWMKYIIIILSSESFIKKNFNLEKSPKTKNFIIHSIALKENMCISFYDIGLVRSFLSGHQYVDCRRHRYLWSNVPQSDNTQVFNHSSIQKKNGQRLHNAKYGEKSRGVAFQMKWTRREEEKKHKIL